MNPKLLDVNLLYSLTYVSASEDRVTYGKQASTVAEVNKVSYQLREILSAAKWYPEAAVSLDNMTLALPLLKHSLTRPNMLSFPNSSRSSRSFYSQPWYI